MFGFEIFRGTKAQGRIIIQFPRYLPFTFYSKLQLNSQLKQISDSVRGTEVTLLTQSSNPLPVTPNGLQLTTLLNSSLASQTVPIFRHCLRE